jgi:hypothetical protein
LIVNPFAGKTLPDAVLEWQALKEPPLDELRCLAGEKLKLLCICQIRSLNSVMRQIYDGRPVLVAFAGHGVPTQSKD